MQERLSIRAVSACISTIRPASASLWLLLSLFPSHHAFHSSFQFRQEATRVNSQCFFNNENGQNDVKEAFSCGRNQRGTIVYQSCFSSFCSLSGAFSLRPFTRLVSSPPPPIIFHSPPLCKSISIIIPAALAEF